MGEEKKPVSLWWVFVPIFLGALGGAITWKIHKDRERDFAIVMLVVGLAFTLVIIPFYIWLIITYF